MCNNLLGGIFYWYNVYTNLLQTMNLQEFHIKTVKLSTGSIKTF